MPLIRREDGGARTFGSGRLLVRGAVPLEIADATMRAAFTVQARQQFGFSLRWASPEDRQAPEPTPAARVMEQIHDTAAAWRSWEAEHDVYQGDHHDLVQHSARVLKGLTYRPTGAIVAAPTTSLPETVGGERNWDYRGGPAGEHRAARLAAGGLRVAMAGEVLERARGCARRWRCGRPGGPPAPVTDHVDE